MYVGFGDNLPYLAYYPSMALANPDILDSLSDPDLLRNSRLKHAIIVSSKDRKKMFGEIDNAIQDDLRLKIASDSGREILGTLNP